MNKSNKKFLILLSALTFLTQIHCQKTVTVTCTAVGVNVCSSLQQYRLTGAGLDESICVPDGTSCNMALNATF